MDEARHVSYRIIKRMAGEPNLDEAAYRVIHASQRTSDVRQIFHEAVARIENMPTASVSARALGSDPFEHGGVELDWNGAAPEPSDPNLIRCVVGEALHSMRSALDSLVYNIAWLDGGRERTGSQLPAKEEEGEWEAAVRSRLRGVNAEHVEWLREIQPFTGCTWWGTLAHLSNRDKHRYLLDVSPALGYTVDLHSAHPHPTQLDRMALEVKSVEYLAFLRSRDWEDAREEEVLALLGELLLGTVTLVNRFLEERGEPLLEVSRT